MYRSDVVGSLLRPDYLKEARAQYESERLSDQTFKEIEDRAVDEAVALQLHPDRFAAIHRIARSQLARRLSPTRQRPGSST